MAVHLATVKQVSNALGLGDDGLDPDDATARLWLDIVSGAVRLYTGQTIHQETTTEYQTIRGGAITPRQFPIVAVSKVETLAGDGATWYTHPATGWRLLPSTGRIVPAGGYHHPGRWTGVEDGVRITYTHGFASIPDELSAAVARAAAGLYNTPAGITSDRVGARSATYRAEDLFSPLELVIVGSYREARTA